MNPICKADTPDAISIPAIEINTELRLRPLTIGDAQDVFDYSSDEQFCRFLKTTPPQSVSDSVAFIEWILSEAVQGKRCYWGIEHQGKITGTIGLLNIDLDSAVAEVGFGISRSLWGSGIINACMHTLITYTRENLPLHRLRIGTDEDNQRAIAFALKSGFSEQTHENGKAWFTIELCVPAV